MLHSKDLINELKLSLNEYDIKYGFNSKFSTNSKIAVNGKLEYFCNFLDAFLRNKNIELDSQRVFSQQIKLDLFKENPVCKICGNGIHNIKDAEIDHVVPWILGGKTDKNNAQIVHRTCNRHKSAN